MDTNLHECFRSPRRPVSRNLSDLECLPRRSCSKAGGGPPQDGFAVANLTPLFSDRECNCRPAPQEETPCSIWLNCLDIFDALRVKDAYAPRRKQGESA